MTGAIITAGTVITMDPDVPRAQAVAVRDGRIVAVGTRARCEAALPGAEVVDTGAAALMPGFVEPHSHPFMSGVATQAPAVSIAPWVAPTWTDVLEVFAATCAASDPALPLLFNGFDALLHGRPAPVAAELDEVFGDRVVVADNSGRATYFTSALIAQNGWDTTPPTDPVGGHFARTTRGALTGISYEVPVNTLVLTPVMEALGDNPLLSAAQYFALMARGGITSTSDMTFATNLVAGYEALASLPGVPLRVSMWHVSTDEDCIETTTFAAGELLLVKQGIKLWTDGSPWIGNVALSFPYLDSPATEHAGIDPATAGSPASLNYSREQIDAILDRCAPTGFSMSFHSNGDLAIDRSLDAYEDALTRHGLLGTDHRWRIEHVGGARKDQCERAARLGVHMSMAPFQYYYWGDLLDGQMFDHTHGSHWPPFADGVGSGACISFHIDGSVSLPTPVLNVQTAVTRRTRSGAVHAPEQRIGLDAALRAHTIDAARTLHRDHLVGSIAVDKLADLVELTADPYDVDPEHLDEKVTVAGTWLGGRRVDLGEFLAAARGTSPA